LPFFATTENLCILAVFTGVKQLR